MKGNIWFIIVSQPIHQCPPKLFNLWCIPESLVIGAAPKLLNRGSEAIVGETGIRVGELYNLVPLQQRKNLASIVTSLQNEAHLSHYCTKRENMVAM